MLSRRISGTAWRQRAEISQRPHLRDALAKQMTPAQIAEAQKLAREWKPKQK